MNISRSADKNISLEYFRHPAIKHTNCKGQANIHISKSRFYSFIIKTGYQKHA